MNRDEGPDLMVRALVASGRPGGAPLPGAGRSVRTLGSLQTRAASRVGGEEAAVLVIEEAHGAVGRRRVLVLNASREPLCVVSVRRAVTLVLTGKAVVIEHDGSRLHSEWMSVPSPLVLVLTRYVHVPHRGPVPPTRRTVLQRDDHRCAYCTAPADTVDHVVPRSRGGRHEWSNVVAACARCNHRKADHLLSEIGWELKITPHAPRRAVVLSAMSRPHPTWKSYLAA